MRFLVFLCFLLLLPQALLAQYGSFEEGTYVLTASSQQPRTAKLKLRDENTLLIREDKGEKQQLGLSQVLRFQVGKHRFVPVGGFHVDGRSGGTDVERGFAELLDSGQVRLYEYRFFDTTPMRMGGGGMMTGGGGSWTTVYLLQPNNSPYTTVVSANRLGGSGREFRETIAPFITSRPDLQKLLNDRIISMENFVPFIRSLNRGLPGAVSAPKTDAAPTN